MATTTFFDDCPGDLAGRLSWFAGRGTAISIGWIEGGTWEASWISGGLRLLGISAVGPSDAVANLLANAKQRVGDIRALRT